jgi:outer membrane lipoprotein-sorting protein
VIKKYILAFILLIAATHQLSADAGDFKKIIEDYLSVITIKASITQHIYPEDGSAEVFSGHYYAASKGLIRIDYLRPERQTVVVNDTGLFWYYNDRKLLFHSDKKSADAGSIPVLMNIIPVDQIKDIVVVFEGMKFYSLFKTADVYSVTSKKNKTKMVLWVDPLLKIMKRKYILDESGREIIKEEYSDHAEINGIYIPSRIELKARTLNGIVHTVTEYSSIAINGVIDKELFRFKVKPDMKVKILNVR